MSLYYHINPHIKSFICIDQHVFMKIAPPTLTCFTPYLSHIIQQVDVIYSFNVFDHIDHKIVLIKLDR